MYKVLTRLQLSLLTKVVHQSNKNLLKTKFEKSGNTVALIPKKYLHKVGQVYPYFHDQSCQKCQQQANPKCHLVHAL